MVKASFDHFAKKPSRVMTTFFSGLRRGKKRIFDLSSSAKNTVTGKAADFGGQNLPLPSAKQITSQMGIDTTHPCSSLVHICSFFSCVVTGSKGRGTGGGGDGDSCNAGHKCKTRERGGEAEK